MERIDPADLVARTEQMAAGHRPPPLPAEPEPADGMASAIARHRTAVAATRWEAIAPSRFRWATLADLAHDPEAQQALGEWSAHPAGRNVVLAGPVGTGKTHAALAAVRPLVEQGWDVVRWPVVDLLDALRPGDAAADTWDEVLHADVLVLDDLGADRPTEWAAERLHALVNARWEDERPTVATTNLNGEALRERIGPRTYSRLLARPVVVVTMAGDDRRRVAP